MSDIEDIMKDQEEDENKAAPSQGGKEIDYLMHSQNETENSAEEEKPDEEDHENESESAGGVGEDKEKVLVGNVERFFSKISVAAVVLVGDLKLGDRIQIEKDDDKEIFTVSSIQINNKGVSQASEGDDVGIKLDRPVKEGSKVYLLR